MGDYKGEPAAWMEKMCWREGRWRARREDVDGPYVKRVLGRGMYGNGSGSGSGSAGSAWSMRFCHQEGSRGDGGVGVGSRG